MAKQPKDNSNKKMFIASIIFLILIFATSILVKEPIITGGATYTGGHSCTISGKTYQSCIWVTLSPGETAITHIPWMAKTFTGIADKIAQRSSGATPQLKAWTSLTNWLNEKIYEKTPSALKNLGLYAKKKAPNIGKTILLIGTDITSIKDSLWPGWKWVDLKYNFYYENDNKQILPYATSNEGFYYKPSTGEIKH